MKAALTTLFGVLSALASVSADTVRGVDPAVAAKYVPSADGTFACLDGSGVVPFSAVNDDFCDCADGSDEPGTSACEGRPAAWFYCENKGHIPGRVLSSRVNDGICDPECCDGSDEWASGACPDRCAEIAREYNDRMEVEAKTRRTGAKIRSTYVTYAQKEKKRLEEELAAKRAEVDDKQRKVESAKAALDNAEAQSREELDKKKEQPLFKAVEKYKDAVGRIRGDLDKTRDDLNVVLGILEELSKSYNPNGQDMAVKAAVVGYHELIGRKMDSETEVADQPAQGTEAAESAENGEQAAAEEEKEDKRLNTVKLPQGDMPRWEIDNILREDLAALLVEDDGDSDDEDGLLYRIEEYIPDALFDYYDAAREAVINLLTTAGVVKRSATHDGPHVAAARERHQTAERDLNSLNNGIRDIENTLERIGTTLGFGPQGEWKKLDGTCVDTVAGDYTYEVCFFGKAMQKSNKDHSSNHLGTFADWNTAAERGTYDYYTKQAYRGGAKCWNGPMRSVNVDLSCGTTNALLSVSEPEKCEYRFKVTTPALCWPLEARDKEAAQEAAAEGAVKDEL